MVCLPERSFMFRMEKELKLCYEQHADRFEIEEITALTASPIMIQIKIYDLNVPTGIKNDHGPEYIFSRQHRFAITVSRKFPFEPPDISWLTPILHPNISPPTEGGCICIKHLDAWEPGSSLIDLIWKIRSLLEHPNPLNPLDTPSCTCAAMLLNQNKVRRNKDQERNVTFSGKLVFI